MEAQTLETLAQALLYPRKKNQIGIGFFTLSGITTHISVYTEFPGSRDGLVFLWHGALERR